jgi:hypothetical protein
MSSSHYPIPNLANVEIRYLNRNCCERPSVQMQQNKDKNKTKKPVLVI